MKLAGEAGPAVDLWWADLTAGAGPAEGLLAPDERARAGRLRHEAARRRWVAARAALRTVLAGYVGRPPAELAFGLGAHGKPALAGAPGRAAPHFSLAHAGERALLAVCWRGPLGVDLEAVRPLADLEGVAAHALAPSEGPAWAGAAPEARLALFYALWTRKEALLKGLGLGLSRPPGSLALLLPGGAFRPEAEGWLVRGLPAPPGYAAALATPAGLGPPALRVGPAGGP